MGVRAVLWSRRVIPIFLELTSEITHPTNEFCLNWNLTVNNQAMEPQVAWELIMNFTLLQDIQFQGLFDVGLHCDMLLICFYKVCFL